MSSPYDEFKTTVYDYAIIGTGVTESIVAASLSHQHKSVVVIDPHQLYGVHSTYINYRELENNIKDLTTSYSIEIPLKDLALQRSISIDLTPQLFYANGSLINIIAEAEIHKYMEFLSVDAVYLYTKDKIMRVPDSKNALFTCNDLTLIEKRQLMRFLNDIYTERKLIPEETQLYKGISSFGSLRKYMNSIKLSQLCQDMVIYGICMSSDNDMDNPLEILTRLQKYANSLGKYGTSPFILCRYGFGDVAQGFSRSSSVVGGVFLCCHPFNEITKKDEEYHIQCSSPVGRTGMTQFTVRSKNLIKNAFFEKGIESRKVNYLQAFTTEELPFERRGYFALPGISQKSIQGIVSRIEDMTTIALSVEYIDGEEHVLEQALEKIFSEYKEKCVFMIKYSLELRQWKEVQNNNGVLICSDGTIGINSDVDIIINEAESLCGEKLFRDDEIVEEVPIEEFQELKKEKNKEAQTVQKEDEEKKQENIN
ncbi:RAB GDP-dissociation inhibitor, putative [Entamoeba dispar SAW760]|uniref:RAB GDP-dissociation inhibitor, putative n=1 Tax=Entamoeba dispar (strain ATCC PRA-260 / SAW760) TaxID=370354 RepID=B0ER40_ENTDS|nr:RAB GDP-dissociation inhibitor, putative [Entamoeba dispar SAW760]EDR22993.1 RAB GDP-dissociation inhibitor, putative [Entamoeba dispar SAW760]|eukprot:EDR22993.1 RAB GDP-dissociation inhibitor, putative [Entamoeba dispar SAW760]